MPITKKPEPDQYLNIMRNIAVALKEQLQVESQKNDERMLPVYNIEEKIKPLIKMNNQINLIIPLLSTVISLPDEDDLPFETALNMKNFAEKLSDHEFYPVKQAFKKILSLEMIRTPELESDFQKHESTMIAYKQHQIQKLADARRRAHNKEVKRQELLKEEKEFERSLEKHTSQCIIC